MCQTGSRKCAADGIHIDQLHYFNAECPFWVFDYISMICHLQHSTNAYNSGEVRDFWPWAKYRWWLSAIRSAVLTTMPRHQLGVPPRDSSSVPMLAVPRYVLRQAGEDQPDVQGRLGCTRLVMAPQPSSTNNGTLLWCGQSWRTRSVLGASAWVSAFGPSNNKWRWWM